MNEQTLKALKGSIKKWERIVAGTGVDKGIDNCPLCKIFWSDEQCGPCPVKEKTGENFCRNSPYKDWAFEAPGTGTKAETEKQKAAALAELKFLKSLLP